MVPSYPSRNAIQVETLAGSLGIVRFRSGIVSCVLGRSGSRVEKQEGDGASPVGVWPLRRVLYRPDRLDAPVTALPVQPLSRSDGWCDDPAHPDYNLPVTLPHSASCEHLWREDRAYDVIVVLGYNDSPVRPGLGSAIFMHVTKPERSPTAGCVALDLPDLLLLLSQCYEGDCLQILPPAACHGGMAVV